MNVEGAVDDGNSAGADDGRDEGGRSGENSTEEVVGCEGKGCVTCGRSGGRGAVDRTRMVHSCKQRQKCYQCIQWIKYKMKIVIF